MLANVSLDVFNRPAMTRLARIKAPLYELMNKLKEVDLRGAIALSAAVRRFVSEQVTVEQAEHELEASVAEREETFLHVARTRVYDDPASPYIPLLKLAGCEYADLEASVRGRGLEKTLERLAQQGVYLTPDEWKGKIPVVRGTQSFWFVNAPGSRNGRPSAAIVSESSGSRNAPRQTAASFEQLAVAVGARGVFLEAHDLFSYSHAVYDAILPSGGVRNLLSNARLGIRTERWFARELQPKRSMGAWYYYALTYLIVLTGRRFGPGFPAPEFIGGEDVDRIVSWVVRERARGKRCCITTTASNALRIARCSLNSGKSIAGTKFVASGEPLTPAKLEVIARSGAEATPNYGSEDIWVKIGYGCANPVHGDEMHVNGHLLTMIEHPETLDYGDKKIRPLLFSVFHPLRPRIALNVANGDYATVFRRDCGCLLQRIGFTLHIRDVRSYEKFTSEGMNYFYGDLFEVFEKALPAEFGGGPGDYQLVEEEDATGQTRLTLLVHPHVSGLDEERLIARLKEALGRSSQSGRFMTDVWGRAGTFRVVREPPRASTRGKILPLHVAQ